MQKHKHTKVCYISRSIRLWGSWKKMLFSSLPHPAWCSCPPTQLCYLFNPLWACFSSESKSTSSNLLLAGHGSASLFASEKERNIYRLTGMFNIKKTRGVQSNWYITEWHPSYSRPAINTLWSLQCPDPLQRQRHCLKLSVWPKNHHEEQVGVRKQQQINTRCASWLLRCITEADVSQQLYLLLMTVLKENWRLNWNYNSSFLLFLWSNSSFLCFTILSWYWHCQKCVDSTLH